MDADIGTTADRRHGLGLGEDFRVRADADFQILRPEAHILQQALHFGGLFRAGDETLQVVTEDRG
ncbi:hypothetical protein D3C73_1135260 [compost metagenome]